MYSVCVIRAASVDVTALYSTLIIIVEEFYTICNHIKFISSQLKNRYFIFNVKLKKTFRGAHMQSDCEMRSFSLHVVQTELQVLSVLESFISSVD